MHKTVLHKPAVMHIQTPHLLLGKNGPSVLSPWIIYETKTSYFSVLVLQNGTRAASKLPSSCIIASAISCLVSVSDFTVSLFQELLAATLNSTLCYGGADLQQWTFAACAVFNNLWEQSKLEPDADTELFLADADITIQNVQSNIQFSTLGL